MYALRVPTRAVLPRWACLGQGRGEGASGGRIRARTDGPRPARAVENLNFQTFQLKDSRLKGAIHEV